MRRHEYLTSLINELVEIILEAKHMTSKSNQN